MATGNCVRCGRKGHVEYGPDGLPYCSSCIFYGLNKQCWRCRMYIPATELQQYKGQWTCPVCLQDMRAEESRESLRKDDLPMRPISYSETCERCGKQIARTLYIWNGRKLCRSCLEHSKKSWDVVGGGPSAAPQRITLSPLRIKEEESAVTHLIAEFLALLGLKKKKEEPVTEVVVYKPMEELGRAKPMAEEHMEKKEQRSPQSEGLMKGKKAKKKSRKSSSFPETKKKAAEEKEDNPFKNYKDKKK